MREEAIRIRIEVLKARKRDNGRIVQKLERELRKIQRENASVPF